jgi:hypothetical protein
VVLVQRSFFKFAVCSRRTLPQIRNVFARNRFDAAELL